MDLTKASHIDERLGHVAVDMGLMTKEQVSDTLYAVVRSKSLEGGGALSFASAAVELGYLTSDDVAALEQEERRRRRLIAGYEIIDLIGIGNVSTAYRARQLAMDREVALKILHPRLASDPDFVKAYIAEAQAVSRFHHPHIVQGYDAGQSNGFFYFAHEYLSGGSMAGRIAAGTAKFSESRLLRYLRQTTSALKHAWAVAVYHGDINPGNLLMDGQGNIKLANLGVPRVAGVRCGPDGKTPPGFVRCGPDYAAPEQLDSPGTVNPRTDIYSLGATFYHISFGAPPFPGQTPEQVLESRRNFPMPTFALKRQESFSAKYLRLIHDMLEEDPKKRPADPEELADRLEKFHLAESDHLTGLARQVRQAAAPQDGPAGARRASIRATVPNADPENRVFSLRRRRGRGMSLLSRRWLIAAIVCLAGIAAALLLTRRQ